MKKSFFLVLVMVAGIISYAQCDKNLVLTSSKTEYFNGNNVLERTVEENTIIEVSKSVITIKPGSEENKMTGPIKSTTCEWKQAFKEGKTVIKATVTDGGGDAKDVTITIEGKDGKLTLIAQLDDDPTKKIRVAIDKFEEKG